jgi:hypothetical protein
MTTYFVAPMTCPQCGGVTPDDTSTAMQTGLGDGPGLHLLRVGDVVPHFRSDIERELIPLRAPPRKAPIILLQEWYCASCGSRRFAHIEFTEDGRVLRIDAVPLTRTNFDKAHFADDGLAEFYQDVVGEPLYVGETLRPDFVERLRSKLPDHYPT